MRLVVLPQAVRNVLPDLISNALEGVKLPATAYFILPWPVARLLSKLGAGNSPRDRNEGLASLLIPSFPPRGKPETGSRERNS